MICLCFSIVRRLITLISIQAQLLAQAEASQKQAQSANDAAKKLMEEKENITNMVGLKKYSSNYSLKQM